MKEENKGILEEFLYQNQSFFSIKVVQYEISIHIRINLTVMVSKEKIQRPLICPKIYNIFSDSHFLMDPPNIKMVTLCSLAETIQPNESDKTVDLKFA